MREVSNCCVHRQQIQHATNQLAKETNKHLKELGSIPLPSSAPQQVNVRLGVRASSFLGVTPEL